MKSFVFKLLILLLVSILFMRCGKPEIILLCREIRKSGNFSEIYLIKDHPKQEYDLHKLMQDFNKDLYTIERYGSRLFIKQHDWENPIILGDNIDYEKTKCEDLDNMDFLYMVSKDRFYNGGDTVIYYYYE